MLDLVTTGGAGGIGVIVGAVASFFGLKARINALDKLIDDLIDLINAYSFVK